VVPVVAAALTAQPRAQAVEAVETDSQAVAAAVGPLTRKAVPAPVQAVAAVSAWPFLAQQPSRKRLL
jgi:hypothetical protein